MLRWVNHTIALAGVVVLGLYGRVLPLVCAGAFLGTSTAWLWNPGEALKFASVVSGSALLCALVVVTTGKYRKWASVKMMAAVLTQGSASSYTLFHIPWPFQYAPTDATLINSAVAIVSMGCLVYNQQHVITTIRVALVHTLLASATLVLRIDAPAVTYTLLTWLGVLATGIVSRSNIFQNPLSSRTELSGGVFGKPP